MKLSLTPSLGFRGIAPSSVVKHVTRVLVEMKMVVLLMLAIRLLNCFTRRTTHGHAHNTNFTPIHVYPRLND